jgi:hypothetical protein
MAATARKATEKRIVTGGGVDWAGDGDEDGKT